jgi:nitrate/TMAO reductase-like tetraheme cytochrome c subunit
MFRIVHFIEEFLAEHKGAILVLLLLIAITGGILGHRYYKDTRENPEFCATCHMMQESFRSWELSAHRDIICQHCHRMSMLEQNKLLITYVMTGYTSPQEETHGRVEPWKSCRDCHMQEARQGSMTMRKSHGHARHVFMENIDCLECHDTDLHNFGPDEQACKKCHEDRLVHGLGMEGLECLNCHSYAEETVDTVSDEKCLVCHKDIPRKGFPMAQMHCFDCHKPHVQLKLKSADCLGQCHGNESRVGQHGLHMRETELECLDCHKSHHWEVGKKEAPGLCDRCHRMKDPNTFIY